MKTTLTTDVSTKQIEVAFDNLPPQADLTGAQFIIRAEGLAEKLYPTPTVGVAINFLLNTNWNLWMKVKCELTDQGVKTSHGSFSSYNLKNCRDPLCSYGAKHDRKGDLPEQPDFGTEDWCIWHIILSHRLYQKVVRRARIEIW